MRNTVSVSLQQSERQRLNTLTGFVLTNDPSDYDNVLTRSASLSLSHKLSGLATLTASYLRSRAEGEGAEEDTTTRSAYSLGVTRSLSPDTSGSLTYRHIKSDGDDSYTENAVTAVLGMRF